MTETVPHYLVVLTEDDYERIVRSTEFFDNKEEAITYANQHTTREAHGRLVDYYATVYVVTEVIDGIVIDGSQERENVRRNLRRAAAVTRTSPSP